MKHHSAPSLLEVQLRVVVDDGAWGLMHFLLTNDDGIDAAGLEALAEVVRLLPGNGTFSVVAPAREQSQCGHRVTTHEPLEVEMRGEGRYAVHGTPADCVRVALFGLGLQPDVVLSGVNHGGNMGQDLVISGTVAAAREAAYHGIRAVAFSHYLIKGVEMDWRRISSWSEQVLRGLLLEGEGESGCFWNVNFPHLAPGPIEMPERVRCDPARSPLRVNFAVEGEGWPQSFQYAASYASRPQDVGSDVEACFGGRIAISKIGL